MRKILIILSLLSFLLIGMGAAPSKKINIINFNELPETKSSLDNNIVNPLKEELTKDIGLVELKKKDNVDYVMTIRYEGYEYIKDVRLPEKQEEIGLPEYMIGYYFTKETKDKNINRYVIYFTEKSIKTHEQFEELYEQKDFKHFNIATYWNLTTNQYNIRKKVQVWGLITRSSGAYYLDVSLPFNTDKLLAITLDYRYFNNYVFGIEGAWQHAHYTVLDTDKYKLNFAFESDFGAFRLGLYSKLASLISELVYGENGFRISAQTLTEPQKRDYIARFNKQRAEEIAYCKSIGKPCNIKEARYETVFNSENKIYSVHMQNIDRWFQKGATFHEVSIVDLAYEYNGKVYQLDNEDIVSNTPGYIPPVSDGDNVGKWLFAQLEKAGKWISKNWKPLLIVVGIIAALALTIYFWPVIGPIIKGIGRVLNKIFNRRRRK